MGLLLSTMQIITGGFSMESEYILCDECLIADAYWFGNWGAFCKSCHIDLCEETGEIL